MEKYRITQATSVIRGVMTEMGGTMMFNDRLKDGTRSYKVWGWGKETCKIAQTRLEQIGFQVSQHCTQGVPGYRSGQYRLHVCEK